ncbi:hypothetical protein Tco_1077625, partial [Tanacetum coccineum]
GKGYRVIGLWGKVRGELGEVLERWFGAETVGNGGRVFAVLGSQVGSTVMIKETWRLDYVREYMEASEPYFSVREYWDSLGYIYGGMDHNQDAHRIGLLTG